MRIKNNLGNLQHNKISLKGKQELKIKMADIFYKKLAQMSEI